MGTITDAKAALENALDCFSYLLKRVNGWDTIKGDYKYPSLLPDVNFSSIETFKEKLNPNPPSNLTPMDNNEFLALVKNDFSQVGPKKGHIEFKAFTALVDMDSKTNKYKPIKLFQYPPENKVPNWRWGVSMIMDIAGFSIDYDFTQNDYYIIKLNDLKIAFDLKSSDPTKGFSKLENIFTTPPVAMTVEIKIPKPLDFTVKFPDITLEFFGFKIDLNPNFPDFGGFLDLKSFDFKPLHLNFPDWLKWPFGPIDFDSLLDFTIDCKWNFGLIWPKGRKFKLPIPGFSFINPFIDWLCNFFGFPWKSNSKINYFTHVESAESGYIPEWAAIYFDLSGLCGKILGGLAPKQLHLMLGFHKSGQVKVGFLTCTDKIGILQGKHFMMQASLQYDFELKEELVNKTDKEYKLEAHPGFALEVLSGSKADNLAKNKAGCPVPLSAAKVEFGGFSVEADRLGMQWEKDENAYVFYIDGKFIIKELLKDAETSTDLELPFKGLGFTTDGKLVLKKTWITLDKAQQVKLDEIKQIGLFIRGYGYGKEKKGTEEIFWIGFSGDIKLPVLNLEAGVDRLVIRSHKPFVELSGIKIDYSKANVFSLAGAVAWGQGLIKAPLTGYDPKDIKGFGGRLALGIPAINLECALGLTYVKCLLDSGDLIAWSFYGDVTFPKAIPICCGLGLKSLGLMVGDNYLPLPKERGIPHDKWLEQGYNGDVTNILNIMEYWTVKSDAFGAGFYIGLVSTGDDGYIIKAKAIMVIVIPGPLVMIAGKANILSSGAFDLLIIYDHNDPGILTSLAFKYDVKSLVSIKGTAEIYFDFNDPNLWHFYLGTPDKPVGAKILKIFEASGYLTIDPHKLAAGALVYYGKSWRKGPLYVKAFVSFGAEVIISWNPAFVQSTIMMEGDITAKVFGFGFDIGLYASLLAKAPNPWYLFATADATFSISFIFFSWSYTAHLTFSWGSDDKSLPNVVLTSLYDESTYFKLFSGSLRSYANLKPNPGGISYLPMDGVLGFQFARDIEIDDKSSEFPDLEPKAKDPKKSIASSVVINDETSEHAKNFKKFHGRLTDFKVRKKGASDAFTPVSWPIFFNWIPEEATERKKLITRDFDLGYSQFRLNDDPNAWVKLKCPHIYQTGDALLFNVEDPDLTGGSAVDGSLVFSCESNCFIEVKLTKSSPGDKGYTLYYRNFTVKLTTDGAIPLEGTKTRKIIVRPDDVLEFGMPAACVMFLFEPAKVGTPPITDCFTLQDEFGIDITKNCENLMSHVTNGVILNDFDKTPTIQSKVFSTQMPPQSGIKKIVFKEAGAILLNGKSHISLYPLKALQEIHKRNLERIQQQAHLEYVFDKQKNPGKLLWEVGEYEVSGKAVWRTTKDEKIEDKEPSVFSGTFKVIPPFERIKVKTKEGEIEVHPFDQYVRRTTPVDGARPFYRDQYPVIAYRCNYINVMLKKANKRLAMFLVDCNNNPCRYSQLIVKFIKVKSELNKDILEIAEKSPINAYKNISEFEEIISNEIQGLTASKIEDAYGPDWKTLLKKHSIAEEDKPSSKPSGIRTFLMNRDTLLGHAKSLCRRRISEPDKEARKRAATIEKILSSKFIDEEDRALVFEIGDNIFIGQIHVVTGIVEYRYMNDDLALDVSTLTLSDCLKLGKGKELNAYERGYFKPIVPKIAFWDGPTRNTKYTAKIYCLDKDKKIGDTLPSEPELYSFSFTTSLFGSIEGLKDLFKSCKVRDLCADKLVFDSIISKLKSYSPHQTFSHPDGSGIKLHLGMDIFRELHNAQAVNASGPAPRVLEENYQKLMDEKRTSIEKMRKEEGLVLESLLADMNLTLDPLSPKRITATWFRTAEGKNKPEGTICLMIDFPEPIDWERTGMKIEKFSVQIEGEKNPLDLLNPPAGDPSYEAKFYGIRSYDGTRLMLIPKIVKTSVGFPQVVIPGREWDRSKAWEIRDKEGIEVLEGESEKILEVTPETPIEKTREITEVSSETPIESTPSLEKTPSVFYRNAYMGDYTRASTMGVIEKDLIAKAYQKFSKKTVENVSNYKVTDLELEFYYFCDNYEDKNKNVNYRAIPRLKFRTGKIGGANEKIGILIPLPGGGKKP